MSTKSAKEWFNQLPEPYRTQAIENWEKSEMDDKNDLFERIEESIDTFVWRLTPQGADYWANIWSRSMKGEFDTPQPNLNGWIPVSERLPEEEGEYLVVDIAENIKMSYFDLSVWGYTAVVEDKIKFWQPLPKLPENL
jgi:hypothetical protein